MLITLFNIFKVFSETFKNLMEIIPLSDESEVVDITDTLFVESQFQYSSQGKTLIGFCTIHLSQDMIHMTIEPVINVDVLVPLISYSISEDIMQSIESIIARRGLKDMQLMYNIDKNEFIKYCQPE